jgi:SAM-dependent methyltransferase
MENSPIMSADAANVYDTIAYPSQAKLQTHPDHLGTLATLFGMAPAPARNCRVLEVGCGSGGNLIPMAFGLPGSTFVGVDLAPGAIAEAEAMARALGLTNVAFHSADLLSWTPPAGEFDFIIAHGFFSWVPEAVRLRLLELCRDRLTAQGVAFISYNVLPGFHIRAMLRDMMRFHVQPFNSPKQKIEQAKALARLVAVNHSKDSEFAVMLRKEARRLLDRRSEPLLFHDDLADINQPYYFHEFMSLAAKNELQYLAEADFFDMQDWVHPAPVVDALKQFAGNIVLKEQYLDFLRCRRFRQTLLCRQGVGLNRALQSESMRGFLIASETRPKSATPDLSAGVVEGYVGPRGAVMQSDDALTKAAMLELRSVWPRALPFNALLESARQRLGRAKDDVLPGEEAVVADTFLMVYSLGLIELRRSQAEWATQPAERPVLNPVARLQLQRGAEIIASLRHTAECVDTPIVRALFLLLDGSRDLDRVTAELGRDIDAGTLPMPAGTVRESLRADVEKALRDAAAQALLQR